ncbi:MAG: PfkB family carbohydrate kinase [Vicinamibacterales bacterium]
MVAAHRVREMLDRIARVSVAVCGDFCLDAYWMMDPHGGEISAETGLRAQAVSRHSYSLGGAANVVANAAALGPALVQAIGVVGDDVFGRELLRQLHGLGVDAAGMTVQPRQFDTVTYGKRYDVDGEAPRIDFGFFNQRSPATDAAILSRLRQALEECDAVVFNQQVPGGLSDAFLSGLNALVDAFPHKVVVCDSRHYGARIGNTYRKTNDIEAARLNEVALAPGEHLSLLELEAFAARLHAGSGKPLFVTRGARGILTLDAEGVYVSPGIPLRGPTDNVGAGDTVTAALALCLGAGFPPAEAAGFANLAAAVTVQKLRQTGTASPEEVLAMAAYVLRAEAEGDRP